MVEADKEFWFQLYYDQGDIETNIQYFSMDLRKDQDNYDLLQRRAHEFLKLGIYDRALEDATRSIELHPEEDDVQYQAWAAKAHALLG